MGVTLEKKMASGMSKILFFSFCWIQWNPPNNFAFISPLKKKVSFVEQ